MIDDLPEDAPFAAPRRRSPQGRRHRSETAIQTACQRAIRLVNGYVVKYPGGRHGRRGTPDLLACVSGRMLAVEVKRPGEEPTPEQYAQLRKWQAAGALAGWVDHERQIAELLEHLDDPAWLNDFARPGDGREAA